MNFHVKMNEIAMNPNLLIYFIQENPMNCISCIFMEIGIIFRIDMDFYLAIFLIQSGSGCAVVLTTYYLRSNVER